tara:strand:+ start:2419 stop:3855 length:1437 start_codon:yes stop_codon:yes gene_type:complete
MSEQHSSEASLVRCVISRNGKKKKALGDDMIASFVAYESIESPFMAGSLMISDSKDFLNTYPIQGGENIEMEVKSTFADKPYVYKFVIFSIGTRIVKNKTQLYILELISPEALINEGTRVQDPLTGNPEAIIKKMLGKEYLDSKKDFFSEPSRFEVRLNPARTRPFDVISSLLRKCVSPKTTYVGKKYKTYEKNRQNNTNSNSKPVKGSAGFFFWETRRGYNFFSIDALCDEKGGKYAAPRLKTESWGPYVEKIANTDASGDERFLIENAVFDSEINLMESLRKGKFSSLMVFFNHSTGQYEEFVYKIKDSYDNMAHLGGQDNVSLVPANQIELSDYPTRVMSMVLDHESWYNEPGIANPEDSKAKDPTKFADWQKYYAAQGAARSELLKNQQGTLQLPGNPDICAGDKIDIRIASKLADEFRKTKPYDTETSGVYLVREATHFYNFLEGSNGTLKTTLKLFRDSYGMKNLPSNHGNK